MELRSKELYGDFYENGNKPLVVVIGGSKAGIPTISDMLLEYLELNYNVLLLAYFGVDDLPKTLERVPVEYFINAVSYFKNKLRLPDNKIILIGVSKGGELLLYLTKYIQSAITVACVPSCYVFQGLPVTFFNMLFPKSSWSLNDKDVPYIKFSFKKSIMKDVRNKTYTSCYENSIEKHFKKDAVINVDNYEGKILLLSAEIDKYWPSKKMCDRLVENSKNKNIKHIVLNLEGHYYLEYEQSGKEIINYLELNEPSLT